MRKKIIGILIVLMLVTTFFSTLVVGDNSIKVEKEKNIVEKSQTNFDNKIEIEIENLNQLSSNELKICINKNNPSQSSVSNNEYDIYEGLHWRLYVTAYWSPPTGQNICLAADTSTLPYGATFDPCHCYTDSVTSTLDWTPYIGQAGTYYITFLIGLNCGTYIDSFTVKVVVHPFEPEPSETYEIYAEQDWHLQLTARWVPTQPERPICLWVKTDTMPSGAIFTPECQCDTGEVTSDFYWTPTLDQIGEYIITFLVGGDCGYYIFPYSIIIIVNKLLCLRKPILTDNSGLTTFYGVFVGGADPTNKLHNAQINGVKAVHDALEQKKGWNEQNMRGLYGPGATKNAIKGAIELFKQKAIPGDEFVFYFCGHGGNNILPDNDGDEPDNNDEHLLVANNQRISDDELTEWLSGFKKCVTINVILDACFTGFFNDGQKDLQNAKDANGDKYGTHMALNLGPKGPAGGCGYLWDDKNSDTIVQIDEITEWPNGLKRLRLVDEDNDGNSDYWWADINGDNKIDENEKFSSDKGYTVLSEKTKKVLEGLNSKKHLAVNDDLTNADRDQDGKTTSKELFEFEACGLYEELIEDNDQDGVIDEDDYDYLDNDGDGMIDEDPAPPGSSFWPNEKPEKPNTPTGPANGNTGQTYSYQTSTTEIDEDDLYYWFEWGDGTNSGWIGPYEAGDIVTASHAWNVQGSYIIKVKARDRCFEESQWSNSLSVSIPKTKTKQVFGDMPEFLYVLFEKILSIFPNLYLFFDLI